MLFLAMLLFLFNLQVQAANATDWQFGPRISGLRRGSRRFGLS
jgi:hypothetical protein